MLDFHEPLEGLPQQRRVGIAFLLDYEEFRMEFLFDCSFSDKKTYLFVKDHIHFPTVAECKRLSHNQQKC